MEIHNVTLAQLEARLKKRPPGDSFVNVTVKGVTVRRLALIGGRYWFEYRCEESHKSSDAQVWYRSHQQCIVLGFARCDPPFFTGFVERGEAGTCLVYRVRFDDGLEWDVFEDELMVDRKHFDRPDPPEPREKR